jgi:5,10-methenyltetrahydrofolate synthetase
LSSATPTGRQALRQRLLQQREQFEGGSPRPGADAALARHLVTVLSALEPDLLGLYWPHRAEFNAVTAIAGDPALAKLRMALPFAQRNPVQMHYRAWNGLPPTATDERGIPTSDGAPVVPDVVLVPCVGFTASGFRLGYGGGYFDRWLAAHPGVTAVGVAWTDAEIDEASLQPQAHDLPLTLIVTERGAV